MANADSIGKRRSVAPILPVADGTINAQDRGQVAGMYRLGEVNASHSASILAIALVALEASIFIFNGQDVVAETFTAPEATVEISCTVETDAVNIVWEAPENDPDIFIDADTVGITFSPPEPEMFHGVVIDGDATGISLDTPEPDLRNDQTIFADAVGVSFSFPDASIPAKGFIRGVFSVLKAQKVSALFSAKKPKMTFLTLPYSPAVLISTDAVDIAFTAPAYDNVNAVYDADVLSIAMTSPEMINPVIVEAETIGIGFDAPEAAFAGEITIVNADVVNISLTAPSPGFNEYFDADTVGITFVSPEADIVIAQVLADAVGIALAAPEAVLSSDSVLSMDVKDIAIAGPEATVAIGRGFEADTTEIAFSSPDATIAIEQNRAYSADYKNISIGKPEATVSIIMNSSYSADAKSVAMGKPEATVSIINSVSFSADAKNIAIGKPEATVVVSCVVLADMKNIAIGKPEASAIDYPATPTAPSYGGNGYESITITAPGANGNGSDITYSVRVKLNGSLVGYVQANGTVDSPKVFDTLTGWGAIIEVTGLVGSGPFTFSSSAKNTDGIESNFSSESAAMYTV